MKTIIAAAAFAALGFAAVQPAHAWIGMNGDATNALTTNAITVNGREINGREINGREINGGTSNGRELNGGGVNGTGNNGRELNGGGANSAEAQGTTLRGFEVQAIVLPAEATPTTPKDHVPAFFGSCSMWKCGLNGTSLTGSVLESIGQDPRGPDMQGIIVHE